jgi:hypothetical protein
MQLKRTVGHFFKMSTKKHFNVYFSGSPSGGFSSFPIEYLNRTETSDSNSFGKGTERSTLKVKNSVTTICYIFYGIGSKTKGKRGGRSFGIWIDIEDYLLPKEEYANIYKSLKNLFYAGIVENDEVFIIEKENGNIVYSIDSFRENASIFQSLQKMVIRVLWEDFGDKLQKIPPNYNGTFVNLIPKKNKSNKTITTSGTIQKSARIKTDNIDKLKYKLERIELEVSHLYKDISQLKTIIFSLLALNLIIAIIAIFTPLNSGELAFTEPPESNSPKIDLSKPAIVNDFEIQPANVIWKDGNKWFLDQDYFLDFLEHIPDTDIGLKKLYKLLSEFLFNCGAIKSKYNGESDRLISYLKGKNPGDTQKIEKLFRSDPAGEIPIDKFLPRFKTEISLSNYIVYIEK